MKLLLFFMSLALLLIACESKDETEALVRKETELVKKEQLLNLKEKALAVREEQVMLLESQLDSTFIDSAIIYNPAIPGQWSVKMVCTETSCTGSAVGDVKNENWIFSYENNRIVVRVKVGDSLTRTYSGTYINNVLKLADHVEATANTPATLLVIRLNLNNNNTAMEGKREIMRPDCKIVYSLQLNKS